MPAYRSDTDACCVVEGDQPLMQVERCENAYPDQALQAWLGAVEITMVEGREVALFESREGEHYVPPSSLRHLGPDWYRRPMGGHQALQEGVVPPETCGGYPAMEWRSSAAAGTATWSA